MPTLEVRLPERESDGGGARAATVSVTQLMHPPDKKAVQAFQSALRLSSAGKYEDAVSELEKAIHISPEFAEAHTNLAVQYFRMGRFQQSIAESTLAIQIGGPDPRNLCNLASAQARLHRFAEAEKSARAALRLDSGYLKANLILGSILADQPATRGEGIKHLEKAAAEFASARNSSTNSGHRAEPPAPFGPILPSSSTQPHHPAAPRRTSAGGIGTCCRRSHDSAC